MHLLLDRSGLKAHHIVGNKPFQFGKAVFDLLGHHPTLHLVGRKTQANDSCRGEVGQLQIVGQRLLPRLNPLGEDRLGQACRDERAVDNLPQGKACFETRHHLVLHQVLHLVGHPGQRDDDTPLRFEPHAGSCTVGVVQDGAAGRHLGLRTIQGIERDSASREQLLDMRSHRFVVAHRAMKELGEGLLRDVVLRRAETAGEDHDLRLLHGASNRGSDLIGPIADRTLLAHDNSCRVEVLGDGYGVGIDDLSDQDLVADGNNGCLHGVVDLFTLRSGSRQSRPPHRGQSRPPRQGASRYRSA